MFYIFIEAKLTFLSFDNILDHSYSIEDIDLLYGQIDIVGNRCNLQFNK